MKESSELITAIAALIAALAWPAALLIGLLIFKAQIAGVFEKVQKLRVGPLEAELERVADESVKLQPLAGTITPEEVRAATRIEAQANDLGEQALLRQLDRLCIEYDTVRRTMRSGESRTQAMTRILVQMRTLGLSISSRIDAYKSSGSPGSRLAAIAMMQMEPDKADIDWLLERYGNEAPFLFYHASLALQNLANDGDAAKRMRVQQAARSALKIVNSFPEGSDANTIEVLAAIAG